MVYPVANTDFDLWNGEKLSYSPVSVDTETIMVDDLRTTVPEMVLATVSDGDRTYIVRPQEIGTFLFVHSNVPFVGFNWAFDFWVIHNVLNTDADIRAWFQKVERNQVIDLMLLDQLIRLAEGLKNDGMDNVFARNLDKVSQEYAGIEVPKDSPYRTRFGEILGADLATVDPGFLHYAAHDAYATAKCFRPMVQKARQLLSKAHTQEVFPTAERDFGLLTVGIQTKAAIALADITRRGIGVNRAKAQEGEKRLRDSINYNITRMVELLPDIFHRYKSKQRMGEFKRSKLTGLPSMRKTVLEEYYETLAKLRKLKVTRAKKTKKICTSAKLWKLLAPDDPVVQTVSAISDDSKVLQFLVQLTSDKVHPRYTTLVRTGRTSASGPNIQQMPRHGWFREIFIPKPGPRTKLAAIDYSFIELRTLAAVCLQRFGYSQLAEVIKNGVDPHAYTAAMFLSLKPEEFLLWKKEKPDQFKFFRQAAKAVNFGVPGGLGPVRLRAYAQVNYGVELTEAQAEEFRERLITEVYPELEAYLDSHVFQVLGERLKVHPHKLRRDFLDGDSELFPGQTRMIEKTVRGMAISRKGRPYSEKYVNGVFQKLSKWNNSGNTSLTEMIEEHQSGDDLYRRLFNDSVVTLTGRVRSNVAYSEVRNTPFQGLAADGAKLALWRLVKEGFHPVAFVHDEVLLEVQEEEEAKRAEKILMEEMSKVVGYLVPIAGEVKVSDCWTKP